MACRAGQVAGLRGEPERRGESAKLEHLVDRYGDAWRFGLPGRPGEPWTGSPRRPGFPVVTGTDLDGLTVNARIAAQVAGLRDMLTLEREYQGWRVWRDSQGLWWATRHEPPAPGPEPCGPGVIGGTRTLADFSVLMHGQADRRARATGPWRSA